MNLLQILSKKFSRFWRLSGKILVLVLKNWGEMTMMKKLAKLLEKRSLRIVSNDTFCHGRFTVVELKDDRGNSAIGLSRLSDTDDYSDSLGVDIARGRAEHALFNKLKHRKLQHVFMG